MIELEPLPVAPDAQPQEVAVGPQMVDSEAATPSEREDTPVEPEPPPEPIKPIVEPPTPEDTPEIETLPEVPTASVVIAQAAPPPREEKPKEEKPKPEKQKPKQAQKRPPQKAGPHVAECSDHGCAQGRAGAARQRQRGA